MKRISVVFFALTLVLSSCMDKATKYFNSGKYEFEKEEYELAAQDMQQALSYGAPSSESNFVIAESYRLSNRLGQAEEYYQKAIEGGITDEHAYFYYAFAMKANGNYEGAKKQFKKYIKEGSNFAYIDRAKNEVKNLDELSEIANKKSLYHVENCGEINTDGIEYSPMMFGDDLYFTSSRGEGPLYPGQGTRFTDLFVWKFDGLSTYSGVGNQLNNLVNLPNTHEATTTFSPDGTTMIFSRSNNGKPKDITQEVDLFETKFVNGDWTEPVRLEISETYSWDSNPCISPDGKTLFWSSNREGGKGSDDIWFAVLKKGKWVDPKPFNQVNTEGAEQFPYMHQNGDFYFSSDGHVGYGGLDLYAYKKGAGGKKTVQNLGRPINSPSDDFGITFKKEKIGFFTSNRPEGKGDDDIWYFGYNFEVKYILEGTVYGWKLDESGQKVTEEKEILPNSVVLLEDSLGNVIAETTTDANGNFKFDVEPGHEYIVVGKHDGYLQNETKFSTIGKRADIHELEEKGQDEVKFSTEVTLTPIVQDLVIEFAPIYYPYNKWNITPRAEGVLNEMVTVLKDNPTIMVELGSHTDARGSMGYNDRLSQNRAESAVEWILTHGIDKKRLTAKGYGERKPLTVKKDTSVFKAGTVLEDKMLEKLEKTDTAASELGHQLNRRTEFTIVGVIEEEFDPAKIEVINNGEQEGVIEQDKIDNEKEIMDKYLEKEPVKTEEGETLEDTPEIEESGNATPAEAPVNEESAPTK